MKSKKKKTTPAAALRAIPWDWIAAALALVVLAWMITLGTWDFFGTSGHLESFFDEQADSMLHGRVDVPYNSLRYESFVRNGKVYGYWGPTPALLRMPLILLFPSLKGHWSRWSMLAASILALVSLIGLLRLIERHMPGLRERRMWTALRPALVLALGLGSTNLFIVAETKVYQESILWGATLALAHFVCLGWYLTERSGRWLGLACATAFLAFSSRVSTGAGAMVTLALVDAALLLPWPKFREYWLPEELPHRARTIAALTATLGVSAVSWSALNYWRFGRWLTSQPLEMNLEFTPQRLAAIKGQMFSLANLPFTIYCYLSPKFIHFFHQFPWVFGYTFKREEMAAIFPYAHIDGSAPWVALPSGMPQLLAAALGGTALALWRGREHMKVLRLAICGAAIGGSMVFVYAYVAQRYEHDLFPWFAVGTAAGMAWVAGAERSRWRTAAAIAFAALTLYSTWVNLALGLEYQRLYSIAGGMEKSMRLVDLSAETAERGLPALWSYLTHRRIYVAPESLESGNVELDRRALLNRPDQPVLRSSGQPPYRVRYVIDIPEDGVYELAIRYASAEPRPALLGIDGRPVGYVFTLATGGDKEKDYRWGEAGRHRLQKGPVILEIASQNPFPAIHALRLIQMN